MSQIINLRQIRKQRERAAKRAEGDANAARSGRTKAESARQEAEAEKAARDHAAHRREPGPGSD